MIQGVHISDWRADVPSSTSMLRVLGRALARHYETAMSAPLPRHTRDLMDRLIERDQVQTTPRMVLIVEDDPTVRALAVALLEETDLAVLQSASAEEALQIMREHGSAVAMLFTDIKLAGKLDGVTLVQAVRRHWPGTLVLVTSGGAGERVRDLPPDTTFMPKPWRGLDVLMQAERACR